MPAALGTQTEGERDAAEGRASSVPLLVEQSSLLAQDTSTPHLQTVLLTPRGHCQTTAVSSF